ncbi:MAG: hypothetical protein Udaeo2_01640 [Candidatus Udaeobacter sp.]|nr:MAG: hypothetical protein Udaeo2_01640 [Candidatus Udaeobacter sp.]
MRMHSSKLLGTSVHDLRKRFGAAGIIPGQTSRDVIRTFHQQRAQKIDPLISVACFNVQFHRLSHCICWLHCDLSIEKTALRYNERRK